jgi:hypothetical protein
MSMRRVLGNLTHERLTHADSRIAIMNCSLNSFDVKITIFVSPNQKRYRLVSVKYLTSDPLIIKKLSLWIKQTRSWFHIHQRWKVAINSASAITKCFSHSVWNKFSHWFPSDCKCCACARNIRSNQLVWGRFENWILAYDVIHTKLHSGQQHGEDVNDNKFVGAAQQSLI